MKFRGKPFKFLWSQGGDQFDFEEKLDVSGSGYPGVAVIFEHKKMYGKMRKSFNQLNLEDYLNNILDNKAGFGNLPELPKLDTLKVQGGCSEDLCADG